MRQLDDDPIWLGNAGDGRRPEELYELGIRAVVELAVEESPLALPRDLLRLRFPLVDGSGNDQRLLRVCIESVASLFARGWPTLVVCSAGMSRTPAIVAAGRSLATGRALDDELAAVTRAMPADVSPAFWADIATVHRAIGH